MDAKTQARFEARAQVLKALAHPSRLFMVDVLSHGEQCVCELTEMVGSDMSTVSRHVSVLKAACIVADEKRGTQVLYSLKMPCVLRFFDCVNEFMARSAQEQAELASIHRLSALRGFRFSVPAARNANSSPRKPKPSALGKNDPFVLT